MKTLEKQNKIEKIHLAPTGSNVFQNFNRSQNYPESEIKDFFKLPKGLIDTYGFKNNRAERPQTAQERKVSKTKFDPKQHGCRKLDEEDSAYNEKCQHQKPQIPHHNTRPPIQRNFNNYIASNAIDNHIIRAQTQNQKTRLDHFQNKQKKKEDSNEMLKHKSFGQVPNYIIKKKILEEQQFTRIQTQYFQQQDHVRREQYDPEKINQRKLQLKQLWTDTDRKYQKIAHLFKNNMDIHPKTLKEEYENQFKLIEQELKQLQSIEQQFGNIQQTQQMKNAQNKLYYKSLNKNMSCNHWYSNTGGGGRK